MKKITCVRCNTVVQATNKRYNKLVESFAGEEGLKEKYLCRKCRSKKGS